MTVLIRRRKRFEYDPKIFSEATFSPEGKNLLLSVLSPIIFCGSNYIAHMKRGEMIPPCYHDAR